MHKTILGGFSNILQNIRIVRIFSLLMQYVIHAIMTISSNHYFI